MWKGVALGCTSITVVRLIVLGNGRLFSPRSVAQQKFLLAFNLLNLLVLQSMDPISSCTERSSGQKVTRNTYSWDNGQLHNFVEFQGFALYSFSPSKTGRFWMPSAYARTVNPRVAKPATLPARVIMWK